MSLFTKLGVCRSVVGIYYYYDKFVLILFLYTVTYNFEGRCGCCAGVCTLYDYIVCIIMHWQLIHELLFLYIAHTLNWRSMSTDIIMNTLFTFLKYYKDLPHPLSWLTLQYPYKWRQSLHTINPDWTNVLLSKKYYSLETASKCLISWFQPFLINYISGNIGSLINLLIYPSRNK